MTIAATYTKQDLPVTLTANGDYLFVIGGPGKTLGNFNTFYFYGNDFDSGSAAIYVTPDKGTNLLAVTGGSVSADGFVNVLAKSEGYVIRVAGTSGGANIIVDIK